MSFTDIAAAARGSSLQDAEETVRAIHDGAADAVVINGPTGPQIVTLNGAGEPYLVLVERMSDGAMTVGADGNLLFVNRRLIEMTGRSSDDLVGQPFASLLKGDIPAPLPDGKAHEMQLARAGQASLPVSVWAGPITVGDVQATIVTVTDRSIHHRAREIAAAERFARSILEQATDAIVVLDPAGRITHASYAAEQLAGDVPCGRRFSEAFTLQAADPSHVELLQRSAANLDSLLATKPFHGIEVSLKGREALSGRTFLLSAGPLVDDTKQSVGSIVTLTDITARKRAEEQQMMLVTELNHRVKNILAIVQSVATQTVRNSPSLDAFKTNFSGRLRALASAHDVLTKARWGDIELTKLVNEVASPHRERVLLDGAPMPLPAGAAVPLSMVLHELMTNAAKYGSLSNSGRVLINWAAAPSGSARITWREVGGPPVAENAKRGFGTTLIERIIKYDLDGTASLEFRPEGLVCKIEFPIEPSRALTDEPPLSAKAVC